MAKGAGGEEEALGIPQEVLAAVAQYRKDMDQIGLWLEEMCIVTPEAHCKRTDAWRNWAEWCRAMNFPRGLQGAFWGALRARGFVETNPHNVPQFRGFLLLATEVIADT
jgi:phage/plasmid-associated DNA primase